MKVTFRLPSKAIQYGYAEAEVELPDGTHPEDIGQRYAKFTYQFLKGEQAGMEAALDGHKDPVDRAVETITESIPATVVSEVDEVIEETVEKAAEIEAKKPWEQKVAPKAKPWETGGAAPKAAPALDW